MRPERPSRGACSSLVSTWARAILRYLAYFLAVGHPVERQACEDESAWFAPFIEDADISMAHGGQA